jgi:formamidopyrimidine-DNA glycosylase
MPELPEVETLCRQLKRKTIGKKIIKNKVFDNKLTAVKTLKDRKIMNVERRGKTIVMVLDDGRSILIHLRMTGRLLWQIDAAVPKYARWKMTLDDGEVFLVDPRRFATLKVMPTTLKESEREIFGDFDLQKFVERHGRRKTKVKSLIMDQNVVNGIGNIYACEILHRAGIHPAREAATLTKDDWNRIFVQARSVLTKAISKRGTSISDWRDLYGRKGENQNELTCYGKAESACPFCGEPICRVKQSGRGTYFCRTCQK